jgi:diguanylate cyclase (GGDEF)-like protein
VATISLNQSIFRLVVGVVLLTALTIIINVWLATAEQAQSRLNRDLSIAQNVLEKVLEDRENLLFNSASVLTADFGFKQAVATTDQATISSVLNNHGNRIEADLMALISLQGKNIASTESMLKANQEFPYPDLIETVFKEGGASAILLIEGQLFQVMMLTVDAPTPIAIALVGFRLDGNLVNQLNSITQLETTIRVVSDGQTVYSVSTMSNEHLEQAITKNDTKLSWYSITVAQDLPYISKQFSLSTEFGYETVMMLSEDVNILFSDFRKLQFRITAIGVLAIVLAMLFAALFSRKLARPLVSLARIAKRIASGDYSKEIKLRSSTSELQQLSTAFCSMQTNIRDREKEIIFQAQHDILTSLYNRHHIKTMLSDIYLQNKPFLAVGINIFGFRGINDIFGYHNGDLCLQELAKRVDLLDGLAARLTGGELLWVPNYEVDIAQIEKIKETLEQPINTDGVVINLKVAIGLLNCPGDARDAEELFRRMNIVLDEAQITRQFILPYDAGLEERYLRRLSIITELKTTLNSQQNELNLFYQPKLSLVDQRTTSVEALIRWNSKKLGFVSPEDFIAIAEHAGFIETVTEWVIERAIQDAQRFEEVGMDISIAINLSARDVMSDTTLSLIKRKLLAYQVEPNKLSFEITEGDIVRDQEKAITQLEAFRDFGFKIAIDDFGTGYSSMAYLQKLPVNTIKIDKSFVLELDTQQGDQHIVKTVLELADRFNLTVVAEGIENVTALALLKEWGCDWAQGYYISKPIDSDSLIKWLHANKDKKWLP